MAFKLVISNTVTFGIQAKLPDEMGNPVNLSFSITARRLTRTEADEVAKLTDMSVTEWLSQRIVGWSSLQDADGNDWPFSHSNLSVVLDILGMTGVILSAYIRACGVEGKAKN